MDMSHEDVREVIALYALGAVSPEEEGQIRAHLALCEACRQEAESFAGAASSLLLATEPAPVPSHFPDRVVERAGASRARRGAPSSPRRWRLGWQVGLAGALIVVALVLGGLFIHERNDVRQRQRVVAALLHHQSDGMLMSGQGTAVAKVIPMGKGSLFVAAGLAEPPSDHTYQLWLIKGSTPVSAGTFNMRGGVAILETNLNLQGFQRAAVTIEPAGGSRRPTTQPVISSK